MRAVRQETFGGPEVLRLAEVERPEPIPTEVLVRVHAAGVNPVDQWTRTGRGMADLLGPPPFTVGWDVSGVVEEVGYGVTRFAVGDEVYGMPRFPRQAGAYAEYVTAPSRHLARRPAGLDHVHAAALPLAGLTAYQALVDTADVQPGQRVLVHAAGGGVGHLAVQIAKARGAYVIGTARADKHAFLRDLGADEVVDYRAVDFTEAVRDLDVVVDMVAGDYTLRSLRVLRPDGVLVSVASGAPDEAPAEAERLGVRFAQLLVEPDHRGLERLTELVEGGHLRVHVDRTFPLERAAEAHEYTAVGHILGKVVLTVG